MNKERLMKILLEPRVTEKSTQIGEKHRQFVFKVTSDANKPEIKQAVELMFEVQVDSVRIVTVRGKNKIFKQIRGRRPGWKKAYVTLKPGFDIDFMTA